jgi:DNA repair exonuclease SbcCD ATPase subunit
MVDQEVEETLREIRERVLAESARARTGGQLAAQTEGAPPAAAEAARAPHANGRASVDALSRLQANLSTTERAWSRLPPLLSYRRGLAARIELWVKRQVKRALHWFTWEQLNFNSAVHHALGDARDTLSAHEQRLSAHEQALARAQADIADLRASFEQARAASDARVSDIRARLAAAESRLAAVLEQLRAEQQAFAETLRADRRALADGLRDEQRARAAEALAEMRERADRLLEEQRVCFKQLSLEAGEAAVMYDRARRQLEARLEALEKAVTGDG